MKSSMKNLLKCLIFLAVVVTFTSPAHAWWNPDWTVRKKITLDASPAGGNITDPIGTAVILVRLHDGDFSFSTARDDGSDIRFIAADDKTPLTYHIEKYDSLLGEAFVWVKVPDLKPGAATTIWLYYGDTGTKSAPGAADTKGATYDDDTVLVYHFAEHGAPAHDSTSYGNDSQNPVTTIDGSLIGPGLRLDGKSLVTIPAKDSLAWTDGGSLTWSAWINPTLAQPNAVIFSRRDGVTDFVIGLDNEIPFVEINGVRSAAGAPISAASWHNLAVTVSGGTTTLYLDGASYGTLSAGLPALKTDLTLGGDAAGANAATPTVPFVGGVDELEIDKTARPVGLLKIAAQGQGGDASKFLVTGTDESAPTSWLAGTFGLFGVILRSVTLDGWVVIGILGIMSLVSWWVMITKFMYLRMVAKGNASFLAVWRQVASDLTILDHADSENMKSLGGQVGPNIQKRFSRKSPLYRIYHIGSVEISRRVNDSRILSSRSIQAIRASLDSGYVHENHRLGDGLVFLTISIAGGPFMGLLGTVIGVMITFAAIAATGEVNISAIAPGLAAALVATVAGLLVAIPALLGYNYLVAQMKTITSDLHVFIDEFVTKMAEFYNDAPVERAVLEGTL
jgi:biopolymer transport protein ExbB